jgi:hypothetical protein
MISLLLMMAGFVLFVLSGLGIPDAPRFRMQSWGLACWILAELFRSAPVTLGGYHN